MGRHIRNTECNGHMCGCRNFDSERDRYLSEVTQQVNEGGETRIISVLGVVLESKRTRGFGCIVCCSQQLSASQ